MAEQSEDRKPDLSNFPRGAISIKGLPVSRNARLPSIRIPRDLTLGAQPKRTFKPNIPVRREKRVAEPKVEIRAESSNASTSGVKPSPSKGGMGKGRGRELIQTEGGLFEMGTATVSKDRTKDASYSRPNFSSGRASSGKKGKSETRMMEANHDLDTLLRDDFIDDGSDEDEESNEKPVLYPYVETKETTPKVKKEKPAQDFNDENFAKDLGFDVHKISKFIKKEKTEDGTTETPKKEVSNAPENDISRLFNDKGELLLKLPKYFPMHYQVPQSSAESNPFTKNDTSSVPELCEGKIGKIQILKSGKARLVVGSHIYPLDYVKELSTEHKLYTIETGTDTGDMHHIGNPSNLLSFSPDVAGRLASLKIKK